jgi:hypothetical protein
MAKRVFYWQYATDLLSPFERILFNLIGVADDKSRARLAHVYPMEVLWVERWENAENVEDFFNHYLGDNFFESFFSQ